MAASSLNSTQSLFISLQSAPEMLAENPWQARPTSTVEASLNITDLPPIYEKAFRILNPQRGKVSLTGLKNLLALDGLPPTTNEQIINRCISPGETSLGRNTFKLALALVALAQKNMDPSFDNVLAYIGDLPAPSLPGLDSFSVNPQSAKRSPSGTVKSNISALKSESRSTLRFLADPWQAGNVEDITSTSSPLGDDSLLSLGEQASSLVNSTLGLKSTPGSVSYSAVQEPPLEVITINPHDQLEGFIFKHLNYVVTSERFNSQVLRRYSEFHALYCFFIEKYPYRLIPDIPPKRLGVNDEFLEKRRKGLLRFMTFISNHPVLSIDERFKAFLTDTELTGKFRASVSGKGLLENEVDRSIEVHMQEGIHSLDYLARDVPQNLEPQLDNLYLKLKNILQHYNAMIAIVDRVARRASADSNDLAELSRNNPLPNSIQEQERDPFPSDSYFPDEQLPFIMLHLQKLSLVLANNADALDDNIVEALKSLRDIAQGMISLLIRSQKRPVVDEERIRRRIKNNSITLNFLTKEPAVNPAEIDKLNSTIEQDKLKLQHHHASEQFVRRTLWFEYQLYREYQVRSTVQLLQDLVNDQINYCNLTVHNWRALADQLSTLS
ncbi:Sorting nexin mvp1 [Entomophthora muscae]|uniref:Sorting nexin mvp1 n=1 Tax=Entomophthora muscae TaxID=34485 RepID=A0ACC2S679_9FUNG|nr:Sorting nexin mvp1 [Entomophthora muscae]